MAEKTIEDEIRQAIDDLDVKEQEAQPSEVIESDVNVPADGAVSGDESGDAVVENDVPVKDTPVIDPPQAWTAVAKKDWAGLPAHIQAEIIKRENDTHKMFTSHEGELRLGREMKEVIDPFLPAIKESGAEPKALIQDLLGTVTTLRNGTEEQKIMVMRNIAQGYGVDLNKVIGYQNNPINQLYSEISGLKQQLNPEIILNQLQERQESARIKSEVDAFAADPANVHFEKVKPIMAQLLSGAQAANLQEAYDMACYAAPDVRSTMLESVKTDEAAKRKMEVAQKKNAAVSIKGRPSAVQGNASPPKRTLEEELAANFDAIHGSKL